MDVNGDSSGSLGRFCRSEGMGTSTLLTSQTELEKFLKDWVTKKQKPEDLMGKVGPLWALVSILEMKPPERVESVLRKVDLRWTDDSLRDRYQKVFYAPLPPTLATYMIDEILASEGVTRLNEIRHPKQGDELRRHWIKVIKNSFLWLNDLLDAPVVWLELLVPNFDSEIQRLAIDRLSCMTSETIEQFYDESVAHVTLSERNDRDLESYGSCFATTAGRLFGSLSFSQNWVQKGVGPGGRAIGGRNSTVLSNLCCQVEFQGTRARRQKEKWTFIPGLCVYAWCGVSL